MTCYSQGIFVLDTPHGSNDTRKADELKTSCKMQCLTGKDLQTGCSITNRQKGKLPAGRSLGRDLIEFEMAIM